MSWGEKSCVHYQNNDCPIPEEEVSCGTCNVKCKSYVWDEVTTPDTDFSSSAVRSYLSKSEADWCERFLDRM